jgi:hypothetical protein
MRRLATATLLAVLALAAAQSRANVAPRTTLFCLLG